MWVSNLLLFIEFDDLLLKEWLSAMENGYFKFKLDSQIQTKIINNGDYSFVFQVKMLLASVYTL